QQDDVHDGNYYHFDSEDEILLISFVRRNELKWTTDTNEACQQLPFLENVGPNIETPLYFFLHLFSEHLLNTLVFQTNLYAVQKNHKNNSSTTNDEIKCFLGINLLMGVKKLPSYRDFWSSNFALRDQFISSCMSRDRFGWLLTHLHLNDNSVEPKKDDANYDKLYKRNLGARVIKDLTRDLVGKCYEVYFDNYFNSVQLQRFAQGENLCVWNSSKDREGVPADLKTTNKKMKRGDSCWKINEDGVLALQWMDKKPILFFEQFS
ncbi:hypothetical protein NQ318_007523, partial [Aromia moschata]